MAKFTNTQYKNTINNLIKAQTSKLDNPYYMYSDQKGTVVNYYAQNIEKSTLDQAAKIEYSKLGGNSPLKYNLINDFVLYGIDRIVMSLNSGEWGLEADPIEGEAIVLPNTIYPKTGDYFVIPYIKEDVLFYVNDCNFDTLDTGANIYKISYKLEYSRAQKVEDLNKQVVKTYNYIVSSVGTDYKTIIESSDFDVISNLEDLKETLIGYFKDLFFDDDVQTFIYCYNCNNFYDPYSIEFMIRNNIFNNTDKYTYVTHQAVNKKTFNICYDRSFFKSLDEHTVGEVNGMVNANCTAIEDTNTLFGVRYYKYYNVDYFSDFIFGNMTPIIPGDVIGHIQANELYPNDDKLSIFNAWIKYQNNDTGYIDGDIMSNLKNYGYGNNNVNYYGLLTSIFIIGKYIESLLR